MYFVLWQDLHQLAADLCCKAAANVLCLCWSWEQRWLRSPGGAWQLTNLNSFKQVLFPSTDWLNCPQATENCLYKLTRKSPFQQDGEWQEDGQGGHCPLQKGLLRYFDDMHEMSVTADITLPLAGLLSKQS